MHKNDATVESRVDLSVVIRSRNQAKSLRQVLEALQAQRCNFKWEIIIIDHESQDETVELCKEYKARIIPIRHEEFTHGRSLNLGVSEARGELVLICSAHSIPVGAHFLESVAAPFTDRSVAAVRCIGSSDNQQIGEWYTAQDVQYGSLEEQKTAEAVSINGLALAPAEIAPLVSGQVLEVRGEKYSVEIEDGNKAAEQAG